MRPAEASAGGRPDRLVGTPGWGTLAGQEFDPWPLSVNSSMGSPPEGVCVGSRAPTGFTVLAWEWRDRRRLGWAGAARHEEVRGRSRAGLEWGNVARSQAASWA